MVAAGHRRVGAGREEGGGERSRDTMTGGHAILPDKLPVITRLVANYRAK